MKVITTKDRKATKYSSRGFLNFTVNLSNSALLPFFISVTVVTRSDARRLSFLLFTIVQIRSIVLKPGGFDTLGILCFSLSSLVAVILLQCAIKGVCDIIRELEASTKCGLEERELRDVY